MNGHNGIIIDSKVYEPVKDGDCGDCDLNNDLFRCSCAKEMCYSWDCAFRFSQELTDKLNSK